MKCKHGRHAYFVGGGIGSLPGLLMTDVALEDWSRAPREPAGFAIARTPATDNLFRLGELLTVSKARLGAGGARGDDPVDFIGLDNVVPHRDALTGSLRTRLSALRGELRSANDGQVLFSRLRQELNKVVHVSRALDSLPCYCTPESLVLEACPERILAPVLCDLLASAWVNGSSRHD